MLKNYVIKNRKILFIIQTILFTGFIFLTMIYYWDRPAHIYFNRSIDTMNVQNLFSQLMTFLFVFFSIIILVYPILLLIQIYHLKAIKGAWKKLIILLLLYFISIVSVFALLTINGSHTIKTIN